MRWYDFKRSRIVRRWERKGVSPRENRLYARAHDILVKQKEQMQEKGKEVRTFLSN